MPFKSFRGQDIYIKKYTRKHLLENVTIEQSTMSKTKDARRFITYCLRIAIKCFQMIMNSECKTQSRNSIGDMNHFHERRNHHWLRKNSIRIEKSNSSCPFFLSNDGIYRSTCDYCSVVNHLLHYIIVFPFTYHLFPILVVRIMVAIHDIPLDRSRLFTIVTWIVRLTMISTLTNHSEKFHEIALEFIWTCLLDIICCRHSIFWLSYSAWQAANEL